MTEEQEEAWDQEALDDGTVYQATEKGMVYAKWYVGTLEYLGFSHPELPSVNRR